MMQFVGRNIVLCNFFLNKTTLVKTCFIIILLSSLGCSASKKYDKSKAIPAIKLDDEIKLDDASVKISIKIPAPQNNQLWLGSSSKVNQTIENIEKDFSYIDKGWLRKRREINLRRTWYKNMFYFEDFAKSFVYSPIIVDGKIFNIDSSGDLTAFALDSKKEIWHRRIFEKLWLKNYKVAHIGACDDKLFAVAGVNQIKAVSQIDGEILWSKDTSAVLSSTPICDGDLVYIISNDNKTFAFNQHNGEIQWIHYGIAKSLAIFGNASPVIQQNVAIVAYSSGEIYALDKKTGVALWSSDLNSYKSINANLFLNDIDATPVVKDQVVYAIGNGGLMKAINLKNGEDVWEKSVASVIDFWLAGEFLYVINNNNQLMALHKKSGGAKWIVQLPKFKNPKKITSKYNYIGVIMAGGKLVISREDGEILIIAPEDGKIEKTYSLNKKILHVPIIVNNKFYFYGMNRYKTKLIEIE